MWDDHRPPDTPPGMDSKEYWEAAAKASNILGPGMPSFSRAYPPMSPEAMKRLHAEQLKWSAAQAKARAKWAAQQAHMAEIDTPKGFEQGRW